MTLLLAGHETTATGLAWTFDLLLHTPRVLAQARRREDAYLDAVVKEALRIRPVIPGVGRVVREQPFRLNGYEVPAGVEINPSIRTIHRRGRPVPRARRRSGPSASWPRRARHLHLDPVRRRHAPLPGRELRADGDARRASARVLERAALTAADPALAKAQFRAITLAPKGGVRVIQQRPPLPAA